MLLRHQMSSCQFDEYLCRSVRIGGLGDHTYWGHRKDVNCIMVGGFEQC